MASFPAGSGSPDPVLDDSPIFIVGLPRSGSTLLEMVLASHSKVSEEVPASHATDRSRWVQVHPGGEDTAFAPAVGRLLQAQSMYALNALCHTYVHERW